MTQSNSPGRAAARSCLYRVAATLLHEPDEGTRAEIGDPRLFDAARRAAADLGLPERTGTLLESIEARATRCTREEFLRVFSHTVRGRCSPYEAEYDIQAELLQAHTIADAAGTYRAFGAVPAEESHERADHVTVECEFMSFLCYKEALALESGNAEALGITRDAETLFLAKHLGRFVPTFAARTRSEDPDGFYGLGATFLLALLEADAAALGVTLGPPTLTVREPDPDGDEGVTTCGVPDGLGTSTLEV